MKVPSRANAEEYLSEAEKLNPGPWVQHSRYTAEAAQAIANHHPRIDSNNAYVMGLLHDIGRREGVTDVRHAIDGYNFLNNHGHEDAARICITHMFPSSDLNTVDGRWDCTEDELKFIRDFLLDIEFTEYDRLIQLSDAVAMPNGFCLIEKRMIDVALRYGVSEYTVNRWRVRLETLKEFEDVIGQSIYKVLPGVVGNTFGFLKQ
jgi:hypothetical protein